MSKSTNKMWPSVSSSPARFLFLAAQLWAASQAGGRFPDPDDRNGPSSAKQERLSSQTGFSTASTEKELRDLVKSWCSAYRQSHPERLAALEMTQVEIVDRFGDSYPIHKGRNAPAWQACFAVSENSERADVRNATNRNDAPQDRSTGDRRGWRPSRRKPQGLLYFSIDYFVINASLPR